MISFHQVTFAYPKSPPIFEAFDWNVLAGERWAVLGPSGCGKSTLLYLLAGLQQATSGQILIAGRIQSGPRPQTGLILQDYGLLPWATARKNITLGLDIRRFYGPDGKHTPEDFDAIMHEEHVDTWIKRLSLTPHINKYPAQLSGGQRQRVAIARTMALNPDLLLMDEPFSSLDAPTRVRLQDQTFELSQEQALTLIIVTHSIEEAAVMGEKILLLKQPPNRRALTFSNSQAGDRRFRETPAYFDLCRRLRQELEPT
ncbi:MAG: ATP-binding cassette domain-containing protein [Anaerolineaceae bacterium]|jgi:NitT/TauT family transport system ATP-binding protein|nr:MAG: ATP-binding cassette domain-containing protein [Anaerolineaceae bacterium]